MLLLLSVSEDANIVNISLVCYLKDFHRIQIVFRMFRRGSNSHTEPESFTNFNMPSSPSMCTTVFYGHLQKLAYPTFQTTSNKSRKYYTRRVGYVSHDAQIMLEIA